MLRVLSDEQAQFRPLTFPNLNLNLGFCYNHASVLEWELANFASLLAKAGVRVVSLVRRLGIRCQTFLAGVNLEPPSTL